MASSLLRPRADRACTTRLSRFAAAAALAAAFGGIEPAEAETSFNFVYLDPGTSQPTPYTSLTRTFSSGGINLTVDNAQGNNITTALSNQTPAQSGGVNTDRTNGLCVALYTNTSTGKCQYSTLTPGNAAGSPTLTGLTFTFDRPVRLLGFQVFKPAGVTTGRISFSAGSVTESFTFQNPGGLDPDGGPDNPNGNGVVFATIPFTTNFKVAAGTGITLDTSATTFLYQQGGTLTGEAGSFRINNFRVEEVPGPLPALGLAAGFGWSRRMRQKLRRAQAGSPVSRD